MIIIIIIKLKEGYEILEKLFDHTNLYYLIESSKVVMQP